MNRCTTTITTTYEVDCWNKYIMCVNNTINNIQFTRTTCTVLISFSEITFFSPQLVITPPGEHLTFLTCVCF